MPGLDVEALLDSTARNSAQDDNDPSTANSNDPSVVIVTVTRTTRAIVNETASAVIAAVSTEEVEMPMME